MIIATLKRPVVVQLPRPTGGIMTEKIKVLKAKASGDNYDCTDVAWEDAGRLQWYSDWWGIGGIAINLTIPLSNIEGTQELP